MHESWKTILSEELKKPYVHELQRFLETEYQHCKCCPPQDVIFRAFDSVPYNQIKVVILGQDPYHGPNQATGLAFGISSEYKGRIPPSLMNVEKELVLEFGGGTLDYTLDNWAKQGVFLLNTVLTGRLGGPAAHAGRGWEQFTDEVVRLVSLTETPTVFMLWGKMAESKKELIENQDRHLVLTASHPSPYSANRGFFGCNCFKAANEFLRGENRGEIKWLQQK